MGYAERFIEDLNESEGDITDLFVSNPTVGLNDRRNSLEIWRKKQHSTIVSQVFGGGDKHPFLRGMSNGMMDSASGFGRTLSRGLSRGLSTDRLGASTPGPSGLRGVSPSPVQIC